MRRDWPVRLSKKRTREKCHARISASVSAASAIARSRLFPLKVDDSPYSPAPILLRIGSLGGVDVCSAIESIRSEVSPPSTSIICSSNRRARTANREARRAREEARCNRVRSASEDEREE